MGNPIILFDNRLLDGTPTATDTYADTAYNVLHLSDLRTYTLWRAASFGTKYISVDCATDKNANAVAFINHNLFTAGALVSVESSADGIAWTERLAPFTPGADHACLKTFTLVMARYWRVKIVTAAIIPYMAVLVLGQRLDFPYPPDAPFSPVSEGPVVASSMSKTGNLLGVDFSYTEVKISISFTLINRSTVFGSALWGGFLYGGEAWGSTPCLKTFWNDHGALCKPFFWAWDLTTYPDDVLFCRFPDEFRLELPVSLLSYIDRIAFTLQAVKED